jgi:hypothetical protein
LFQLVQIGRVHKQLHATPRRAKVSIIQAAASSKSLTQ